uniref:Actin-depolymerizing factor 9 (Trinotate prediction) n=1 Tax=Myxobolus squamalis TaxID=59785 RepID=A0A6B2GAN2_MYXSQ
MASGIKLNDSVVEIYNSFKKSTGGGIKYRALQLALSSKNTEFEVEKKITTRDDMSVEEEFQLIADSLPFDDCRYLLYDIQAVDAENVHQNKILLISWSPDSARVDKKMLYASSKGTIKQSLDINTADFVATDHSELKFRDVCERAKIRLA